MPARKTTTRKKTTREVAESAAVGALASRIPAAIAGAAARRALTKVKAKASRARRARKARATSPSRLIHEARSISRKDVKKILDKGVSGMDQLLESGMKWVVKLAIRAKALYDMLSAWWHGKYSFPSGTLQAIAVGLLYLLSPFDILPDFLPLFGLADDAAVIAFVMHRIRKDLEEYADFTGKKPEDLGF